MIDRIKIFFKKNMPYEIKYFLKRKKRQLFTNNSKILSLTQFENILKNHLKITKGSTVLVHSSFGSLRAKFSPLDAIKLLKEIITPEGNILMPYYPKKAAITWLSENNIFDFKNTRSSMGILANTFMQSDSVRLSPHPIKSLAVWGKDREWLIKDHYKSLLPFDRSSPYFKLINLPNSKSIGLGIERMTFIHSCEDTLLEDVIEKYYCSKCFIGRVKVESGLIENVKTYVHSPEKMEKKDLSEKFLKDINCPYYHMFQVKNIVFYRALIKETYNFLKDFWGTRHSEYEFEKRNGRLTN